MYIVVVKASAVEGNEELAARVEGPDDSISFPSKEAANEFAARFSKPSHPLRIQAVAPSDPADVDGYLIADPDRSTHEPLDSDTAGLTFQTDGNQYGELGEAVVFGTYGISPGMEHALRTECGYDDADQYSFEVSDDQSLSMTAVRTGDWVPDCVIDVRDQESGRIVEKVFCEIKTGAASFERNQQQAMRSVAATHPVLKVRVDVDSLPDRYTLRVKEVEPTDDESSPD